jgi:hypothetical protein
MTANKGDPVHVYRVQRDIFRKALVAIRDRTFDNKLHLHEFVTTELARGDKKEPKT